MKTLVKCSRFFELLVQFTASYRVAWSRGLVLRPRRLICALVLLLTSSPIFVHAQTSDKQNLMVEAEIKQVELLVAELGSLAQRCLYTENDQPLNKEENGLEANSHTLADAAFQCQTFMAAIDGDPISQYLQRCSGLKQWRREFSASSEQAGARLTQQNPGESADLLLQRMTKIEYFCGEGALTAIHPVVQDAFTVATAASHVNYSESETRRWRMDKLQRQERQYLQRNIKEQSDSRLREQQAINQRLEQELIRQQIRPLP